MNRFRYYLANQLMSNSGKGGSATTVESAQSDPWSLVQDSKTLDPLSLDKVWERCPASGKTFEESLIESGVITSRELAEAYSRQYLLPLFDPPANQPLPIDPEVGQLLPGRICLDAMMAPLADDGTTLDVAIVSPEALRARDEVLRITGRQMRPLFATLEVVESILAILYSEDGENPETIRDREPLDMEDAQAVRLSPQTNNLTETSQAYIKHMLEEALERKATDIHIDPIGDQWRVRMRISGSLIPVRPPAANWISAATTQLMNLAGLDLAKREQPQEGTIRLNHGRRIVSIDLLTCPTIAGEKFVLKIHGRETSTKTLDQLGLSDSQYARVTDALQGLPGIILIAGPSGTGKRTTLYACMQLLDSDNQNLCSVEEAIRMPLPGVNQFPARPEYGLSFGETVRAVLRRDPDVLMLSDLRDAATAAASLRAASDGKQILAAINCGGSIHAITALSRLGIRSGDISQWVSLVIGQRLVRRQCSACRVERIYDADMLVRLGLKPTQAEAMITDFELIRKETGGADVIRGFETKGCQNCQGTGFRGGVMLFEQIASGAELVAQIRSLNAGELQPTLDRSSLEKVEEGHVNLKDVLRHRKP